MQSETCLSLLDGSELIFDQEVMMGFNPSAAQVYSSGYTNQPGVEGIDPPWYSHQFSFVETRLINPGVGLTLKCRSDLNAI
jgi:hypothetical protein